MRIQRVTTLQHPGLDEMRRRWRMIDRSCRPIAENWTPMGFKFLETAAVAGIAPNVDVAGIAPNVDAAAALSCEQSKPGHHRRESDECRRASIS